ncbi:spermatogenesis-associated protein 31A6-like [Rhynchonycteris naso]
MRTQVPTPAKPFRSSQTLLLLTAACASISSRHLGRPPDKGSFCQHSGQDPSGEVCRTAPEGAHRCCGEPVEDASPAISTSASPASLTECLLPLASALSPDPKASSIFVHPHSSLSASQPPEPSLSMDSLSLPHFLSRPPDLEAHPPPPTASSALPPPNSTLTLPQCDSVALPLGINPQSSAPPTPRSASPIPALSGLGHSSSPTLALSLWQLTAKALCLSASSQFKSQEEHLPHHPPEALCRGDPTGRQIDAGSCSLLRSEKQNVLEIQVTKTIKVKIWKEKEKDRLYAKQMNPNAELCTTASQPLGSTKGKPEQLPRPQQLSYHKVLEDHLQTKYDQLFWGLPSLHSESLMVTVWISENFSTLQSPSLLFNGTSNACPIPLQAKLSPLLSHSQPLSYLKFLAQPLISTTPQFQPPPLAQVQTEGHLQSSLPTLPPSSPPHIRVCGVSCPTAQNKPQPLIPVGIQHPEWPLLQKQLETGWDLSCVVRRSHQVFNVFTSNLPKDSSVISIFSENFPISSEVQKQLEQHLQKLLIQQHQELPPKTQESLERRQHEDKSVEACQARGQHGPSQPSSFTGESSKEAQKVGLQVSQDMGKGLGHILGKIPEDLSRGPESTVVMFQRAEPEDSERDWMHLKSDSESDLLRKLDKNIENILKGHLGSKSDSLVPESVHRSWLPVNHSSAKFHTHTETKNLGILKGWEPHVNTSHSISFPDTSTREVLEAHITEFQVKRRWGLPLKVLRPVNLLKLKKAQVSPILQSAYPPSPTCASGAHRIVKCAEFLGKPPQSCPGEDVETEESAPTLVRPLIAPSPVCEEIQRALGGTPSGDDHGPSKASLTKQKDRPPSQSLTLTWQSGPMEQAERGSLDPSPSSAMAMNESRGKSWGQASQDSCNKGKILEMNLRSQSLRAEETRDIVEAKLEFPLETG